MTFELGADMRTEIDRRLQRFRSRYGEVPVTGERIENDPEDFERCVELARDGWLGEAGAWVTDDDGRALLVRHEDGPDRWEVPGGRHESGETHEQTARREVHEKTGVEVSERPLRWKVVSDASFVGEGSNPLFHVGVDIDDAGEVVVLVPVRRGVRAE